MPTKPSVLVTRRLPSAVLERLESVCDIDLHTEPTAISRESLLARVAGKDALVCLLTEPIDTAVLDAAGPSLKVVANVAVGFNNIDVAACRARGVVVTNTPDVLTNACADFTWALILAVTRRLGEGERELRDDQVDRAADLGPGDPGSRFIHVSGSRAGKDRDTLG